MAAFGVPLAGIIASQIGISFDRFVPVLFLIVAIITIALCLLTERSAKAWRYLLMLAGGLGLLLSLAHVSLLQSTTVTSAGLLSFITGVILLLIGLLVGRDEIPTVRHWRARA